MAKTKIKKMKKVMLVAGMATAMNLAMGINNGGYSMMNEEKDEKVTNLHNVVNYQYTEDDLIDLIKKNVQNKKNERYKYNNTELKILLINGIECINNYKYVCSTQKSKIILNNFNNLLVVLEKLKTNELSYANEVINFMMNELTY